MIKFLKWTFYILAGFALLLFIGFKVLQLQTKKYSPEDTVIYESGGNELTVFYNRPYKKERVIFGNLVPFGEVWRTGANEATTFSTKKRISFGGRPLASGEYTLWTIPGEEEWQVIINKKQYSWGISGSGTASRDPAADVLQIAAPVKHTQTVTEQFTIDFTGKGKRADMILRWDDVRIVVPISW